MILVGSVEELAIISSLYNDDSIKVSGHIDCPSNLMVKHEYFAGHNKVKYW